MKTLIYSFVIVAFTITLCATRANAQSFQKALDAVNTSSGVVGKVISTTDGGYLLRVTADSVETQWKADANGQAVWGARYSFDDRYSDRMPDGGIVFLKQASQELGIGIGDTAYYHLLLARTDGSGNVEWSKCLTITRITTSVFGGSSIVGVTMKTDPAGRIFLSVLFFDGPNGDLWFAAIDASGTLLWSKFFMDQGVNDFVHYISPDNAGGLYFSYDRGVPSNAFALGHFNVDGTLDWVNRYAYTNGGADVKANAMTTVNGQVLAGGGLDIAGLGARWFIQKVNMDGSLDWYTLYSSNLGMGWPGIDHLEALDNGELIATGLSAGVSMIHTAVDGTIINSAQVQTITDAQYGYHMSWMDWDVHGSLIAISGYMNRQDLVFGYHTYTPSLWVLSPDLMGCLLAPVQVASSTAPSSYVVITPVTTSTISDGLVSIVDSSNAVVSTSLIATLDFCSLGIGCSS